MHISFILPDLKGGGAQKMVVNLANWFASEGCTTDLILFNATGTYLGMISPEVNIVDLKKNRAVYAVFELSRYLKKNSPDVVFSAMSYVNIIAIVSKLIVRSKSIMVISERNSITKSLDNLGIFGRSLWKALIYHIYPLSNHIVSISKGLEDDLRTFLPHISEDFVETIYNPVVTGVFEEKYNEDVPCFFPRDCKVKLITSGRFVDQKDYPTLINAFHSYHSRQPSSHLAILGVGELEQDMKELTNTLGIENNVTFLGFVDNPLSYMKQADIFIVTPAWEGFCNVIVEALYCGLNIVTTDCPSGPREILDNGKYGVLAKVGDVEGVSSSIDACMREANSPQTQKSRALDFHVNKIGSQFKRRFESLIES